MFKIRADEVSINKQAPGNLIHCSKGFEMEFLKRMVSDDNKFYTYIHVMAKGRASGPNGGPTAFQTVIGQSLRPIKDNTKFNWKTLKLKNIQHSNKYSTSSLTLVVVEHSNILKNIACVYLAIRSRAAPFTDNFNCWSSSLIALAGCLREFA